MGILLAARDLGLDLDHAVVTATEIRLRSPRGIERVIPTDRDGYFYIDWNGNVTQIGSPGNTPYPLQGIAERLDNNVLLSEKVVYHYPDTLLRQADHDHVIAIENSLIVVRTEETGQAEQRKRHVAKLHYFLPLHGESLLVRPYRTRK